MLLLAGCAPVSPAAPEPTRASAPATQGPPATRDSGPGPGISYEENLRINPPAVRNLAVEASTGGVLLTWQAPPAVTVPHSYSDEILGYKIYRRSGEEKRALLAETQDLRYLDDNAEAGVEYFYTVTALHENNIESTRPDEVSFTR
jgi:hypothetical protein